MKDSLARNLAIALVGFVIGSLVIADWRSAPPPDHALEADFWYDTSDPRQILGEAPFAALVTVEGIEGVDVSSARTIYNLRLEDSLRGGLPTTFTASQLGYVEGEVSKSVEGFPLLTQGSTYLIAFTTPGTNDPKDALVILTGPNGGNAIQVTRENGKAGEAFIDAVSNSQSPYLDSKSVSDLDHSIAEWTSRRPGYAPAALTNR